MHKIIFCDDRELTTGLLRVSDVRRYVDYVFNDTSTPINWQLLRVVQIHPGADGIVRTATLRNVFGSIFKDLLSKLL